MESQTTHTFAAYFTLRPEGYNFEKNTYAIISESKRKHFRL